MKVRCHNCGAIASLDLLLSTSQASQAFVAALDVPPQLKPLVLKYLGLFRPNNRELSFARAATLLSQLTPPMQAGKLTFDRQTTDAPLGAWAWGISQVLAARDTGNLSLPLTKHNYLYRIVQSYDPRKHSNDPIETFTQPKSHPTQTILLNGLKKPVFAGKSPQETYDMVMQAMAAGESADETYERIKGDQQ